MADRIVHIGNSFIYDVSLADTEMKVIRHIVIQINTPLKSMDAVCLEIFNNVKGFMKRGDIISLKSIDIMNNITEVEIQILRPIEKYSL